MSEEPIYKKRLREYREAKAKPRSNAKPAKNPREAVSCDAARIKASSPLRRGDPIPGSMFYRDFCSDCGEAMRVCRDALKSPSLCETCKPHLLANTPATMDDISPWQENAIRAMEDASQEGDV